MKKEKIYSNWFLAPAMTVFLVFFILPMVFSLFFSLTIWDLKTWTFCGLDNYVTIFKERSMNSSIVHTLLYACVTCGLKVALAFFLALFLTSNIRTKTFIRSLIFFPNLVSAVAVGIVFTALMHPSKGLLNTVLELIGINGPNWLGNPNIALWSVMLVDIWKGLGFATVIYISGIQSIDRTYFEAAALDGAGKWDIIKNITFPLSRPAMNSVIILSFIGGMRNFDLIWAMTGGGPGFATDVVASVVYKQYAAGFYGLSTAGNVVMFIMISLIAFPLQRYLLSKEVD